MLAADQLGAIDELVAVAHELGASVWLRGGWAVDFFLGWVTRDHADADWFALAGEGEQVAERLVGRGYEDVTSTPPGQQIEIVRGSVDHGIALVRLGSRNEPLVVRARVIAPLAQIELKQLTPIWNPKLQRRQKDLDDIAAIRSMLPGATAS